MKHTVYIFLTILLVTPVLASLSSAADGDLDRDQQKLESSTIKLEPNKLLTSGGIKGSAGEDVTVEPVFGVSHITRQRELGMGSDDITHKFHAQAGGRLKFSDLFYLGFATKLPIYNYEATEGRTPGGASTAPAPGRHEYDILHPSSNNLKWTGEMGVRFGPLIDLNMYYDQNALKSPVQPGVSSEEKVIGTKFIFKFK